MDRKKVSVIVPVFNAGTYLSRCLGNLLGQTLPDLEIILVDDKSTDNSLLVMADAKAQFPDKVKVLLQEKNQGPGAARNRGIEEAEGAYIGFVDADDLTDVTMYEKLYRKAVETDADIVDCAYYRESRDEALMLVTEELSGEITPEKRSVLMKSAGYMVTKLYRRELFSDGTVRFRPEYGLEDLDFQVRTLMRAKRIAGVPEVLYVYKDMENASSMSKEQDLSKYIRIRTSALRGVYDAVKDEPAYEEVREAAEFLMLDMYRNLIILALRKGTGWSREEAVKLLTDARALRKECIKGKPSENRIAADFFPKKDMKLMELNDRDPLRLYRREFGTYG